MKTTLNFDIVIVNDCPEAKSIHTYVLHRPIEVEQPYSAEDLYQILVEQVHSFRYEKRSYLGDKTCEETFISDCTICVSIKDMTIWDKYSGWKSEWR